MPSYNFITYCIRLGPYDKQNKAEMLWGGPHGKELRYFSKSQSSERATLEAGPLAQSSFQMMAALADVLTVASWDAWRNDIYDDLRALTKFVGIYYTVIDN